MDDPWQVMDDWCAGKSARIRDESASYIEAGGDLESPAFRHQLGQSTAFSRMRSFIHAARQAHPNVPRVLKKMTKFDFVTTKPFHGEVHELFDVGSKFGCDVVTLFYIALVIGSAALTYRFIEAPAREMINARQRGSRSRDHLAVTAS